MIPARPRSTGRDPVFAGRLKSHQAQRQVRGAVSGAGPIVVLLERHVEHPLRPVLDPPVTAHGRGDRAGRAGQGGDVVPGRGGRVVLAHGPGRRDPGNCTEAVPVPVGIEPGNDVRIGDRRADPPFQAAMIFLHGGRPSQAPIHAPLSPLLRCNRPGADTRSAVLPMKVTVRSHPPAWWRTVPRAAIRGRIGMRKGAGVPRASGGTRVGRGPGSARCRPGRDGRRTGR